MIFLALIVVYLLLHQSATAYECSNAELSTVCPLYKNFGVGQSNLPTPDLVTMKPMMNDDGETSLAWDVPFCRNCGFVFSYYPVSLDEGHTELVKDDIGTSLNENILQSGTWTDWWTTGNSLCDPESSGKLMNSGNGMTVVEKTGPCGMERRLKYSSFNDKKNLLSKDGEHVYHFSRTPLFAELSTNIYVAAMYPYSLGTSAEKYSTRRNLVTFTTKYLLAAQLFTENNVITQREITVKTLETPPYQLQLNLDLTTAPGIYMIEDSCKVHESMWGVEVQFMSVNQNKIALKFLSTNTAIIENYYGMIKFHCQVEKCSSSTACEQAKRVDFQIEVDQSSPSEVVVTSQWTPYAKHFSGDHSNPFQLEGYPASSGNSAVSMGIGIKEKLVGFNTKLNYLRMCSGACSTNPEFDMLLVQNGAVVGHDHMEALGAVLHDEVKMNVLKPDMKLGFTFDVASIKTLNVQRWFFEIGIAFEPTTEKRNRRDNEKPDTAYVIKSIDLLGQEGRSSSDVESRSSGSSQAWKFVLPIALPVGGIAICLGALSCLSLCLLGVALNKRRRLTGNLENEESDDDNLLQPNV